MLWHEWCQHMTAGPIVSGKTDPEDANVKKWVLRIAMTFVVLVIAGFGSYFFPQDQC